MPSIFKMVTRNLLLKDIPPEILVYMENIKFASDLIF